MDSLKLTDTKLRRYFSFAPFPGQLLELDGLRGLAVILVLLRHASRPFWSSNEPLLPVFGWDAGTLLINGWIGVDLFFVLSGFLITHHILRQRERYDGVWRWKPYLQKRALRIVPAYYAVLFLAAAGAFPAYEIAPDLMGLRLAYHMLFFQDYLPANIVVAFWSLGVEEKFYLFAPLIVLARANAASLRERVAGIGVFLCIAVVLRVITAVGKPDIDNYDAFFAVFRSPLHMTLDPILMGVMLAFIYRAREEVPRLTAVGTANYVFWSGAILLALLTGIGEMMGDIGWWDKTLQPTAIAISFSAITFGLLFGGGPAAIFRTALLRFFARISYSLYLVHLPLVPLSLLLANRVSDAESGFGVFLTIFVLLSIVAALLIHFAIEKPFLLIKDRIDQGRRNA